MDNDDQMVGRVLSRREALKLMAAASAAMLVGCGQTENASEQATETGSDREVATIVATVEAAGLNEEAATAVATAEATELPIEEATAVAAGSAVLPACIVSPALTEGPFFLDEQLNRSDIRVNSADNRVVDGTLMRLDVRVSRISTSGCAPLEGAVVDIWHCDALGIYSGVTDNSQGFNTVDADFLRGYQVTDADGMARFSTIVPGWYRGRAVHIHFKVRTGATDGGTYEFTSQMFFDEALVAQAYAQEPYASKGMPDTPNARDGIYQGGGDQLMLTLEQDGVGYRTLFDVGLDLSAEPI